MSYTGPHFQLPTMTRAIKQLMLVNAVVFVVNMLLLGRLSSPVEGGGFWFAFWWSGLWEGFGLGLLRLVTYQFTHSFESPMHLLMNLLVLWFFGTMAEVRLGYLGTWKLYLAGGAAGALLQLAVQVLRGAPDVPLVGASGACYSFLVYAAMRVPQALVILIVFPIRLWALAALLVGLGAYSMFVELTRGYSDGVAHSAHLGGALLGFLAFRLGWFVDWADHAGVERPGPIARLLQRLRHQRQQRRRDQAAAKRLQLDELLAKVKASGLGSLSPAERRFLESMSKEARRD